MNVRLLYSTDLNYSENSKKVLAVIASADPVEFVSKKFPLRVFDMNELRLEGRTKGYSPVMELVIEKVKINDILL